MGRDAQRATSVRARPVRRAGAVLTALAACGLLATACGGSPNASVANLGANKSGATTTTAASAGGGSAPGGGGGAPAGGSHTEIGLGGITVAFSQCMRTHGEPNFPDPNSQGAVQLNGVDPRSPQFESAQKACAKFSPNRGKPPSPAQQQAALAQALKFSECMRAHGIKDFPDPQTKGGGIRISIRSGSGSDLNPQNPQFQKAQQACQSLLPNKLGSGVPRAKGSGKA